MGKPNVALISEPTVFNALAIEGVSEIWMKPLVLLVVVIAAKLLLDLFFASELGLAMRATGGKPRMSRAQGISTDRQTVAGLALSNALVALAGALFVQSQGGADISMGVGTIVIGLAAVIIGETLIPARSPFEEISRRIWSVGAEVFLPCAASRLVTREQVDALMSHGLEVVSSGANVPFADKEIFYGPIYEHADARVAVIPDFIANCGMARAFAFLMGSEVEISDEAIFSDVSQTIAKALERCHARASGHTTIASTAFEIALDQLI